MLLNRTIVLPFKSYVEPATDSTYGVRTPKTINANFFEVCTDLQKFHESLCLILLYSPTGLKEEKVISMDILNNPVKLSTITDDADDYPQKIWKGYIA